ncbi:MAG: hypothetical protein QF767_07390 [Alphaproteobacteria bacterium]|nr:hypothetical protein [Alphaproteobacteria bacterium]
MTISPVCAICSSASAITSNPSPARPARRCASASGAAICGVTIRPPSGCRFHPRCPLAEERCKLEEPMMREIKTAHFAACHLI